MLYHLFVGLADKFEPFNVFRYLTFRTAGAIVTALIISFICGRPIINWLRSVQREGQPIRADGPESHLLTKKGTPTMGGALILLAIISSTLLWADLTNRFVWITLGVTIGFGAIGFLDDYRKLANRSHKGVPGKVRLLFEIGIATLAVLGVMSITRMPLATGLTIPFFKSVLIPLGWFFLPVGVFVVAGASNSVNLTDGLDGLAIVPTMIAAGCFMLISYLVGNVVFSNYLQLLHVPGTGELTVFCGAMVGAALGFLWFNAPPAMVFMGDTGALSIGAALGIIAVIDKQELVLAIIGGLFVLETVSVIVQVASFKMTGKRVFRMAPLHHHFEKKGWAEPTVVIRFWIIASILAIAGLSTLKLR
jgi:phospho-N-acetylmuramoyl-pentapeptide-transferase